MKKKRLLLKSCLFGWFLHSKNCNLAMSIPENEKERISHFVREEVVLEEESKHARNTKSREAFLKKRDQILLDEEMLIIQKSTRTTIPQFIKLHNYFRAKYRWYYKWHLFPFVNKLHWSVLGIVSTVFSFVIFTTILGSFPYRVLATNASVAGVATVINTNANLTFDSGTYLSNVTIDNTSGQMAGYAWSDDMGWVDFANTGSSPADPVVVDVNGNLSGKAKVINGGYIDFDSSPTGANVAIAIGGNFSGYAWSDDLGWINFTGVTASGYNPMPADPSAVSIGSIDSTLFTVSWTDNSSNETGFKVFVSTVANADCSLATYPGSADYTTAAGALSQAVTGKSINTQYCAKVVATNADGDSQPAYSSPAYTLANQPNAPTVSGNYSSGNGYFEDVVINTNNNPGSTNFWIQYSTDNLSYSNPAGMAWQTGTSYTLAGLNPNTQYWFKVKAKNGSGIETAYSAAGADVTPPAAPTGLSSSNLCHTSASTSWTASTGADKYTLSYGTDVDATNLGTINNIAATNKDLAGLTDNTAYYFKVLAISNANGTGTYSSVASFTTGSCFAPTAPSDFAGSAVSTTQINWTWSDTAADETGWHVQDTSHNNLQDLPANSTGWNETSLSINTAYTRHANVYNLSGNNDSNQATVYTMANVPGTPMVAAVSSSSIRVTIDQNYNPDANTRYTIYNVTLGKYVKHADGSLQDNPDWQLYADWGGASGFLNADLSGDTSYTYKVKAENGDNLATAFSVESSATTFTTPPSSTVVTPPADNSSTTSSTDNEQNTSANLANGTTNSTTEPIAPSVPATGDQVQSGYKLVIKVVDANGNPVEGAKVTIHSVVQEATSDENGIVSFENVESGDHNVVIAYDNSVAQQTINLSGNTKNINVTVTLQPNSSSFRKYWIIIGCISLLFILTLLIVIFRAKSKRHRSRD
jgi:hypothetical protein